MAKVITDESDIVLLAGFSRVEPLHVGLQSAQELRYGGGITGASCSDRPAWPRGFERSIDCFVVRDIRTVYVADESHFARVDVRLCGEPLPPRIVLSASSSRAQ